MVYLEIAGRGKSKHRVPFNGKVIGYRIELGGVTPIGRDMKQKAVEGSIRVHSLIQQCIKDGFLSSKGATSESINEYIHVSGGYWNIDHFKDLVYTSVYNALKGELASRLKPGCKIGILFMSTTSGMRVDYTHLYAIAEVALSALIQEVELRASKAIQS